MDIKKYLENNRLITDGGMGTYYDSLKENIAEIAERANIDDAEMIRHIHLSYIQSGAQLIRTNSFAINSMFFDSLDERKQYITAAWENARWAIQNSHKNDLFVAADIGPIDENEMRTTEMISDEYLWICQTFYLLGARIFVFETMAEDRLIRKATRWLKEQNEDTFIIVQFCFNRNGYTRLGKSVTSVIREADIEESFDAIGFNCGVGPVHLYELLKNQILPTNKYVTALPNAGYPVELRGKTIYSQNVSYYVENIKRLISLGIDIIGGCCGTTPAHIRGIRHYIIDENKMPPRIRLIKKQHEPETFSLQQNTTSFIEKLERGEKVYAVELDPPFDANDEKLMNGAATLKGLDVDMITIADSPLARPRADAMASSIKLHYTQNVPVMPHISCRDKNLIAHRAQFLGLQLNGIRHTLLVTGDPIARSDRDSIKGVFNFNSVQLMQYLKMMNEDVFSHAPIYYGGALNHMSGSLDHLAKRMKNKMEAGASYFLTQPIYGDEAIERIKNLKEMTGARILAGIMPLVSRKNALFMKNEMPGIHVPDETVALYEENMSREAYEAVAVTMSLEIMKKLQNVCDGYYLMTPFNRVSLIRQILIRAKEELR